MDELDRATVAAFAQLGTVWRFLGRPVTMVFPVAATMTEVLHGLGEIPDGWVLISADANVRRTPGVQWTKDLAFMQVDQSNAVVTLAFGVLREEPLNVVHR